MDDVFVGPATRNYSSAYFVQVVVISQDCRCSMKAPNAVKLDLERRVESMGMSDFIFRIVVPEETIIEKKADGKEKEKVKQLI